MLWGLPMRPQATRAGAGRGASQPSVAQEGDAAGSAYLTAAALPSVSWGSVRARLAAGWVSSIARGRRPTRRGALGGAGRRHLCAQTPSPAFMFLLRRLRECLARCRVSAPLGVRVAVQLARQPHRARRFRRTPCESCRRGAEQAPRHRAVCAAARRPRGLVPIDGRVIESIAALRHIDLDATSTHRQCCAPEAAVGTSHSARHAVVRTLCSARCKSRKGIFDFRSMQKMRAACGALWLRRAGAPSATWRLGGVAPRSACAACVRACVRGGAPSHPPAPSER